MTSFWYSYPFSALSGVKVRPAIVVNTPHVSQDVFIVPLTSRTTSLLAGEFVLAAWTAAGFHVPTVVKRGLHTVHETLILKRVDRLIAPDTEQKALISNSSPDSCLDVCAEGTFTP